jgi:3-oxoacyl-[acyl-carrier protein] reductase
MEKRNILISGISRGLGELLARHYSNDNLVFGLSRSGTDQLKDNILNYKCDISDSGQVEKTITRIIKDFEHIDVLINNSGVLHASPIVLTSNQAIKSMISVNLEGLIYTSKVVFRHMLKQKYGRIINITSMASNLLLKGDSVYAATKAGVEAFGKVLNKEGHPYGITVNTIGLTAMLETGMLEQIMKRNPEGIKQLIPHLEYADLTSITTTIDYLVKDESFDIGGQTVFLGGI